MDTLANCILVYDTLTEKNVYKVVDEMPKVEGGINSLFKKIGKNVIPLKTANKSESKVYVAFIVDADGNINGKRIVKDIQQSGIANQILEIIDKEKWISGRCENVSVDVLIILPVIYHWDS